MIFFEAKNRFKYTICQIPSINSTTMDPTLNHCTREFVDSDGDGGGGGEVFVSAIGKARNQLPT